MTADDVTRRRFLGATAAIGVAVAFPRPAEASPATFPARLHVNGHRIYDSNGYDIGTLKGFCVQVSPTFVWPQQAYTDMAAEAISHGRANGLVRHVVFWDTLHVADWKKFVSQRNDFVLAIGETGIDNTKTGKSAFGTDKAACFNAAGAQVQMWWDYDTAALSSNPFSARPGGTWRASVNSLMAS